MTVQDRAERRSERSDWLTAEQMAALCGVSVATVKRRCEDGKPIKCRDGTPVEIESERISRPQGWEWRVRTMTAPPALSAAQGQADQEDAPALTSGAQVLSERSLDIFGAIFKGNLQIIHEKDAAISRQADTIADLRERVGRAEARASMLQEQLAAAEARAAEAERRLKQPWWRCILG